MGAEIVKYEGIDEIYDACQHITEVTIYEENYNQCDTDIYHNHYVCLDLFPDLLY